MRRKWGLEVVLAYPILPWVRAGGTPREEKEIKRVSYFCLDIKEIVKGGVAQTKISLCGSISKNSVTWTKVQTELG
jgi:hypothetical protein